MDFMCSHTKKVTNTGKRYFVGQNIYMLVKLFLILTKSMHYKIHLTFSVFIFKLLNTFINIKIETNTKDMITKTVCVPFPP